MLLLFDIGNTAVTYGFERSGKLTFGSCLFKDVEKMIEKITKSGELSKIKAIISSVVPDNTRKIAYFLNKRRIMFMIVGKDLTVDMPCRYSSSLGIDRLVTAYGAFRLYKSPLLVIDFGTAATFDYVSKKGVFEGGMIVPGPQLSFQALLNHAALIPKTMRLPKKRKTFLGHDTLGAMESGILEGYGALIDGLVARFKKHRGPMKVISTGGFASVLKPYAASLGIVDPQLSIKALSLIYREQTL